ncbi:MAG: (d)CMP kinase [Puniceicoccales bacterium]|jgi:cytidylate kinase|nr:(d)CMP kinase [Puniceicoccales bacterium]
MNAKKLQLILCVWGLVMGIDSALIAATTAQLPTKFPAKTDNKGKQSNEAKAIKKSATSKKIKKNLRKKSRGNAIILITIDGGSAAKKSPITKSLAEKINLIYLESGALYRTVSYVLLKHKLDPKPENERKIEDFLKTVSWKVTVRNRHACFIIDGEILSDKELRSDQLNATVALYSSQFESVHNFCLKMARKVLDFVVIDGFRGLIAEGRTCGTKTFPEADLKFWFNASAQAKIDFRLNEEKEVDDPLRRDTLDKASSFAPLKEPKGAIHIWTHNRSLEDNIRLVSAFIEQKLDEKNELAQSKKE